MNPATIIREVQSDGVTLTLSPTGTIKATGGSAAVNRWLVVIREHKTAIIDSLKAAKRDPAPASTWWLIHFTDRDPVTLSFSPEVTHSEALAAYPDAVAAEPCSPPLTETSEPFDREAWEERAAICEFDGGLLRDEAEAIAWLEDDRRRCVHCLNLRPGGVCKVAAPGGVVSAARGYRPNQELLQRCAGYRPCPDDPDRRHGGERWPALNQERGE